MPAAIPAVASPAARMMEGVDIAISGAARRRKHGWRGTTACVPCVNREIPPPPPLPAFAPASAPAEKHDSKRRVLCKRAICAQMSTLIGSRGECAQAAAHDKKKASQNAAMVPCGSWEICSNKEQSTMYRASELRIAARKMHAALDCS